MELKIVTLDYTPGVAEPMQEALLKAISSIQEEQGKFMAYSIAIDCRNMQMVISVLWEDNPLAKILHIKKHKKKLPELEEIDLNDFKGLPTLNDPMRIQSLIDEQKSWPMDPGTKHITSPKTKINEIT